jgi:hypothetical protein
VGGGVEVYVDGPSLWSFTSTDLCMKLNMVLQQRSWFKSKLSQFRWKRLLPLAFCSRLGLIESYVRGGVQISIWTFGSIGWCMKLNEGKH